jgi:DNA-binding Lrp family transcriptional regulator
MDIERNVPQQEVDDALEMLGAGYEPRKIVQEISGFYPMFEVLLKRYNDVITPAVFGVAWRYCQMPDGVCKASLRTIAGILNISEATVMRRMDDLCTDGYLIDITPDLRNVPHTYVDAGLVVMKSSLGVVETVSHRNRTVSQRKATVSGSQLIKDSNKESNKHNEEDAKLAAQIETVKTLYEQNIGAATPLLMQLIRNAVLTYPFDWFVPAFETTVKSAKHRSWAFTETVLQGWKDHGYGWKPQDEKQSKGKSNANTPRSNPQPEYSAADLAIAARIVEQRAADGLL